MMTALHNVCSKMNFIGGRGLSQIMTVDYFGVWGCLFSKPMMTTFMKDALDVCVLLIQGNKKGGSDLQVCLTFTFGANALPPIVGVALFSCYKRSSGMNLAA